MKRREEAEVGVEAASERKKERENGGKRGSANKKC